MRTNRYYVTQDDVYGYVVVDSRSNRWAFRSDNRVEAHNAARDYNLGRAALRPLCAMCCINASTASDLCDACENKMHYNTTAGYASETRTLAS